MKINSEIFGCVLMILVIRKVVWPALILLRKNSQFMMTQKLGAHYLNCRAVTTIVEDTEWCNMDRIY